MTFDDKDNNLFWSNPHGIYKYDLIAQKTGTVIQSCNAMIPNDSFASCAIAPGIEKFTFSYHVRNPLNAAQLFHQYRSFEIDLYRTS